MKMLLNGGWVDREEKIEVHDPFDHSVIDTVPSSTSQDVETALQAAVHGFEISKRMTVYERAQVLFKTASIISEKLEDFAHFLQSEVQNQLESIESNV